MVESQSLRSIGGFLAIQAVRYLAAAQSFAMVFFHAGWILLATAIWGEAAGGDSGVGFLADVLTRAYVWLGGVDAGGHGDGNSLMVVWAKLGVAIYLIEAVWRRLFGPRAPMRLSRIMLASWFVAQVGYVVALYPTGDLAEGAIVLIGFPILAGLATGWSVGAHRLARLIEGGIAAAAAAPGRGSVRAPACD